MEKKNKRTQAEYRRMQKETSFATREENGDRYIEGYFVRFGDIYDMGYGITESIDRHAFDDVLKSGADIRALINHDSTLVIGRTAAGTAEFRADEIGVWGRVKINSNDQEAMNAYARVMRGDVNQASFGFCGADETKTVDSTQGTVHYTITEIKELLEFSVCTFPAYQSTSLSARNAFPDADMKRRNDAWKEIRKEKFTKWH